MKEVLQKELLNVRDVAALLDLCERTVWRMSDAGKMPRPVKVGSRLTKWRRNDLLQWLDAGCPSVRRAS